MTKHVFTGATMEGKAILLPTLILYIQVLSLDISLGGFSTSYPSQDTSDFHKKRIARTAVTLTRIGREVVEHPKFSKSFVFDIGIVPPIWITAIVSPYRDLQYTALGLLKAMTPRVECVWDSKAVSEAAEAYLKMLDQNDEIIMDPVLEALGTVTGTGNTSIERSFVEAGFG
jgi:hypothetical protein